MALSAPRVAARHLASTGAECEFFKATDGKWYMGLEDMSARPDGDDGDDEDDDWRDSYDPEMEYYGPFPTMDAAVKYLNQNFANPGGWSEDDSGRRKPPRKPIKPGFGRWAFNKFNPDELLGQLVTVLEKEGLDDAVKSIKKITPDIQKAWRERDQDKTAATHTSPMEAITNPARWGYKVVDVVFGQVRPRRDQSTAMKGDVLQDDEGKLWEFHGREHNRLDLTPV